VAKPKKKLSKEATDYLRDVFERSGRGKLRKMTVVCDDHHKCLKFAKAVKTAAMKVKGKDGEKIRKLAAGFIPG